MLHPLLHIETLILFNVCELHGMAHRIKEGFHSKLPQNQPFDFKTAANSLLFNLLFLLYTVYNSFHMGFHNM
jgi:hypothetical protein